ncbi:diguanylate cyclase [Castellaniella sp.]|uniref:sensor domain-containing diguanylate cyclase n=1 Tax=Castellaniella sp. TaxID=1955812 RepID=UPI003A94482C
MHNALMQHTPVLFQGASLTTWLRVYFTGLLLAFSGLLVSGAALAQPLAAVCPIRNVSAVQPPTASLSQVCFAQDEKQALSPQDFLSGRWPIQRRDADQLVFTHTTAAYWVYVPLRNTDPVARSWFLQLDYPLLDNVDVWVYQLDPGSDAPPALVGAQQMGDARPFDARPVTHHLLMLPLDFLPGESLGVVIRVRSNGAINIPLSLYTAEAALAQTQDQSLALGMFIGAVLLLALFNLTLFVRLKIPQPLFNAFYIICVGLFLVSMSGLSFQYLWPASPWLANVAVPVTEVLALLSLLLFTRCFLGVTARSGWQHYCIRGLAGIGLVLLVASFWVPYPVIIKVNTAYALVSMLAMLGVGVAQARLGHQDARWYVASWLVLYAGFLFYGLAVFGYMPGFMAQQRWVQIAAGSQVFLLTYAEVIQLRGLLDHALKIESSARSSLQQEVQSRTADLRSTMVALQQANRQLRELARIDPLTGLLNRRGLDESLDELLSHVKPTPELQITFVVFDLDHFKRVNDQHGHDAGDEVLKWVAEVLRNLLRRQSDVLARFGGEEFVALLPHTTVSDAQALVMRVLAHVHAHTIALPNGATLSLTLSAGLASWQPGDTAVSLFRRADESLYQAKAQGRNRLVIAPSAII